MNNSLSKTKQMETESIPKLLFKYSSVTFCALLFSSLYNIVDTLFVSYGIGDEAMAGVSVVYPFMILQSAFAQTVGSGAGTIVSKLLGEKKYEKAGGVTVSAMLAFYVTTATVGILCILFHPFILRILGAEGKIYSYAKDYLIIIAAGNVFSTGFSSLIRAEGRMVYSLMIWLVPTVFNILADYVFIFLLSMGVRGAALATVGSQFISFLMSIIFFTKISCQSFKKAKPHLNTIREIIALGVPVLLQMGGMSVIFLVVNNCLSRLLTSDWVSAFAYVGKIVTFFIIPFNAIIQASSPIVSYNFGAKNLSRISKTLRCCFVTLYAYSAVAVLIIELVSPQLMSIFTKSDTVISIGAGALNIISLSAAFLPPILIFGAYFQAIGDKKKSVLINALLIFILSVCIVFVSLLDCKRIWLSIPLGCFVVLLPTIVIFKKNGTSHSNFT